MARMFKIVDGEPLPEETEYYEAADNLAKARVKYSQAFQVAKATQKVSDEYARQIAIEATGDEITKLEAIVVIAKNRLEKWT